MQFFAESLLHKLCHTAHSQDTVAIIIVILAAAIFFIKQFLNNNINYFFNTMCELYKISLAPTIY